MSSDPIPVEWLCKFCKVWNVWAHRFCKLCLAQKQYAQKETR